MRPIYHTPALNLDAVRNEDDFILSFISADGLRADLVDICEGNDWVVMFDHDETFRYAATVEIDILVASGETIAWVVEVRGDGPTLTTMQQRAIDRLVEEFIRPEANYLAALREAVSARCAELAN